MSSFVREKGRYKRQLKRSGCRLSMGGFYSDIHGLSHGVTMERKSRNGEEERKGKGEVRGKEKERKDRRKMKGRYS